MQQGTISWLDYDLRLVDKKWILYDNQRPTRLMVGPRRSSKALPKAKLASKKKSWSLFGGLLQVSDPLQLSESRWNHYIWEVYSANRWDALKNATPATNSGQQTSSLLQCLITCHTTKASKVEQTGLQSFNSSTIFIWPLTDYHVFKHFNNFLQGKCFHNQQEAESAFQEFTEF